MFWSVVSTVSVTKKNTESDTVVYKSLGINGRLSLYNMDENFHRCFLIQDFKIRNKTSARK